MRFKGNWGCPFLESLNVLIKKNKQNLKGACLQDYLKFINILDVPTECTLHYIEIYYSILFTHVCVFMLHNATNSNAKDLE